MHKEFQVPCFQPANGETVTISKSAQIDVDVSLALLREGMQVEMWNRSRVWTSVEDRLDSKALAMPTRVPVDGVVVITDSRRVCVEILVQFLIISRSTRHRDF